MGHTYVPAHGPGIRAGIETMAPFLLGLNPVRVLEIERAMDTAPPNHLYAKGPIDMACWDIAGQAAGLMGGGSRSSRPIASSVGPRQRTKPTPLSTGIAGQHASPVSLDESLVTLQDAARIVQDGFAEMFGIKLNRVGGLTKAARMRDLALAHGIDMFVMATGGSVQAITG